ncbi:MAG: SGNH/GDSL hydrolase family protein [Bacteroidota bacterium]|nr:SGNH/GDSL hydrolase family protein [Bacteroidota bacterium]
MKKIYIFVFTIVFVCCLNAQELKVLFVGNSYTYVNDLPNLLKQLAQTSNQNISTTSFTPGGARFLTHWQNEALKQEIRKGNYDIMILQGQSQEVAFPPSQFQAEVYPYAKKLDSLFKEYNPEGRVIFFMTWGYRYGDANNCQFYPPFCSYESMSMELCQNYSTLASDFQSELAPIGNAWLYLYNQDANSFDLHSSDNSHPNLRGSYFSACVLYTTIFQTSISSDYYADLSSQEALSLQQTASMLFNNSVLSSCGNFSSLNSEEQKTLSIKYLAENNTIEINNIIGKNAVVEIYNILGSKIMEKILPNVTQYFLNVKDLQKGYYILKITDKENISTYKFNKVI